MFYLETLCISCSVMPDSLQPHRLQPIRLLCPWDSPGKDVGVIFHFLLQVRDLSEDCIPGWQRLSSEGLCQRGKGLIKKHRGCYWKRKKNTWNQVSVFKFLHPLNFEILICNWILKCHQIAWNVNFVFLFLFDSAKSPKKEQSGKSNWGCRVFLSDVQDLLMLQPQTG